MHNFLYTLALTTALAFTTHALPPYVLQLRAELSPRNATHVHVNLTNDNDFDLALLTSAGVTSDIIAQGSLTLTPYGASKALTQTAQEQPPIPSGSLLDQFSTLASKASVSAVFNMTQLFSIPDRAEYTLSLDARLSGIVVRNGTSVKEIVEAEPAAVAENLYHVVAQAGPMNVTLGGSELTLPGAMGPGVPSSALVAAR
ncbi:MAG: hypothetical protein M1833_003091 [Piccolia ochrophora]|nr:MAG: hypothetical protein M1833_003091 [Piccolia ochrophora]